MQRRAVFLFFCILLLPTSCTTWVEFTSSSLDFNNGRVHRMTIKDADPASVVERITELAEKRDVVLVFSTCKGDTCECSFKKKPRTVARGSTTVILFAGVAETQQKSVSISSLFFSRISRRGTDVVVDMMGAPVIDENVVGCPMALQVERRCKRQAIEVPRGKTPEQVYRSDMGVDISGKAEAQIISGVFAELRRASNRAERDATAE